MNGAFQMYTEVVFFCILLLSVLVFRIHRTHDNQVTQYLFSRLLAVVIAMFAMDLLWIYVANGYLPDENHALAWLFNAVYFSLSGVIGYVWVLYSETVQDAQFLKNRALRTLLMIPAALILLLSLSSYWTHSIFYIDDSGAYHRGALFFVHLMGAYIPPLVSTVKAVLRSFSAETTQERQTLRVLAHFAIMPLLCEGLQLLFPGVPYLCAGLTFAGVLIYLGMKEQQVVLDTLTGLYNRYQLEAYLLDEIRDFDPRYPLQLVMMDVDDFKGINDLYGHLSGDEALVQVANVLREACRGREIFIARYGGDEFLMASSHVNLHHVCMHVEAALEQISSELPYTLSVCWGMAEYEDLNQTVLELIDAADKELYRVKKERKNRENELTRSLFSMNSGHGQPSERQSGELRGD